MRACCSRRPPSTGCAVCKRRAQNETWLQLCDNGNGSFSGFLELLEHLPTDGHGPVGDSEPLDLGRERRLHTRAQRRALALTHDTCATEGCERPYAWTEIHHPHAWSHGGQTTLTNALPLCGYHHRKAHDDSFTMRRQPTGEVRFRRRT